MSATAPSDEAEVRYALGAGLMLLVGVLTGIALAFMLSRTLGGTYIALLMPLLAGWIVGIAVGVVGRRFEVTDRLPVVLTALLGAAIAYLGYHLIAYTSILQMLIDGLVGPIERAASEPAAAVYRWLEEETEREGLMAYVAFFSDPLGAPISPLGVVARGGLEVPVTLTLFAVDLVGALGAAVYSALRRAGGGAPGPTRAPADASGGGEVARRFAVLAETDDDGVVALMQAIDDGELDAAGRGLARPVSAPTHIVSFEWAPGTGRPYRLKIETRRPDGRRHELKAQREIASLQAESLWDELKLARRQAEPRP